MSRRKSKYDEYLVKLKRRTQPEDDGAERKMASHMSLAEISIDEAATRLAMRKMALARGTEQALAEDVLHDSDFLQGLAKQADAHPLVQSGLVGAGLGAAAGLGATALSGKKKKRWLANAATGALAGGAVGLGGRMALDPAVREEFIGKMQPAAFPPDPRVAAALSQLDQRASSSDPEGYRTLAGLGGGLGLAAAGAKRSMDSTKVLQQLRAAAAADPKKAPQVAAFLSQLQKDHGGLPAAASPGSAYSMAGFARPSSPPPMNEKMMADLLHKADRGTSSQREFVRASVGNLLKGKPDAAGASVPTISNAGRAVRAVGDRLKGRGGLATKATGGLAGLVGAPLLLSWLASRNRDAAQAQQQQVIDKIRNFNPGAK